MQKCSASYFFLCKQKQQTSQETKTQENQRSFYNCFCFLFLRKMILSNSPCPTSWPSHPVFKLLHDQMSAKRPSLRKLFFLKIQILRNNERI